MHHFEDFTNHGDNLIKVLKTAKDMGLIQNFGFSIYDEYELSKLMEAEFDSLQVPLSIWNNELICNDQLLQLKNKGVSIFSRSVFVQGLIFKSLYETKFEKLYQYQCALQELAENHNTDIATIAMSYIDSTHLVDCCIVGVENMHQLKSFVIFNPIALNIREIDKLFSNIPIDLLDPRKW